MTVNAQAREPAGADATRQHAGVGDDGAAPAQRLEARGHGPGVEADIVQVLEVAGGVDHAPRHRPFCREQVVGAHLGLDAAEALLLDVMGMNDLPSH